MSRSSDVFSEMGGRRAVSWPAGSLRPPATHRRTPGAYRVQRLLREAGMVETRRESQTIYYRISDPDLEVLMAALYEAFCKDV